MMAGRFYSIDVATCGTSNDGIVKVLDADRQPVRIMATAMQLPTRTHHGTVSVVGRVSRAHPSLGKDGVVCTALLPFHGGLPKLNVLNVYKARRLYYHL